MLSVTRSLPTDVIISAPLACHMTGLYLYLQASKQESGGLWPLQFSGTVSIPPGIWKLARVIHVQSLSAPPWIWLHVQGAYADADSTAMAFQAIAPVGVKHYQTYQLALSKVGQMENGQVEMGECKQPACT